MKQLFTALLLATMLLLVQQESFAQPIHGVTLRYVWYNYDNANPAWDNWTDIFSDAIPRGVEVGYNRRLDKNTWLVVPAKIGLLARGANSLKSRGEILGNLDVLLQENLFKASSFVNPTLHLGVGSTYNFDTKQGDFNIPAGLGFNFNLSPNLSLSVQSQYRFSIENRPGWQHAAGITVSFGEPAPPDRDKDGVTDADDKCPDVFGLAALMGCPDRDNDTVADGDDKCPDVPGLVTLMGCPDTDGDGITDWKTLARLKKVSLLSAAALIRTMTVSPMPATNAHAKQAPPATTAARSWIKTATASSTKTMLAPM